MAEVYFRYLVRENSQEVVTIQSAGIFGVAGSKASKFAMEVVGEENLSLSKFRSQPLTEKLVKDSSIIVAMTQSHLENIIQLYPIARDKTYTLMSFIGSDRDIVDPYGGSRDTFRSCYEKMKPALNALLRCIN